MAMLVESVAEAELPVVVDDDTAVVVPLTLLEPVVIELEPLRIVAKTYPENRPAPTMIARMTTMTTPDAAFLPLPVEDIMLSILLFVPGLPDARQQSPKAYKDSGSIPR